MITIFMAIFALVALGTGIAHVAAPEKIAAKAAEKANTHVTDAMILKTRMKSVFFFVMAALFAYLTYFLGT
jgi:hypothetical protein